MGTPMADTDYDNMTIAKLDRRARAGDPGAIEAQRRHATELAGVLGALSRVVPMEGIVLPELPDMSDLLADIDAEREAKERAAARRARLTTALAAAGVLFGAIGTAATIIAVVG